jgi:hypothetical protein
MFKVGDITTCLEAVNDLRKGYKYEVINVCTDGVTVQSKTHKVSQDLIHPFDKFAEPIIFNITYTELPRQTVDCYTSFDPRNDKSIILKGTGFKDVYNLFYGGKGLGLVVGTKMEYLIEQVESKIYK